MKSTRGVLTLVWRPRCLGRKIRQFCAAATSQAVLPGGEDGSSRLRPFDRDWAILTLAAIGLFCLRLPFLPPTLEDIDSINFDLGVHDFDPSAYRPHPPGYPVFILLATLAHPFFESHARALGFVSALLSSLSVFPLYFLARELISRQGAAVACALTLINPLVWLNSLRPMSDLTGLFWTALSQCLLLKGLLQMDEDANLGRRLWRLGVVATGLAVGVRLQSLFLVGPILLYGWIRYRQIRLSSTLWLTASLAAWLVPVIYLSGGPTRYVQSFLLLIRTALPVEPLVAHPTIHRAAFAMWDTLGASWGTRWLAVPVLFSSAVGALMWALWNRRALALAALLFLPYAAYHYLLQMTETIRYAIPIVPLVGLLAAVPFVQWRKVPRIVLPTLGLAFATLSSAVAGPALVAYATIPSPAAQALAHLEQNAARSGDVVVSGNHVFERYLARLPANLEVLLKGEGRWLWPVLVDYWKQGGRKPILFLRDPMRTMLLQAGRDTQTPLGHWSWPAPLERLMKGERPLRVELVRLDPPRWFCESGFLVTLEAGKPEQVANETHRAYVRPSPRRRALIASGSVMGARETTLSLWSGDTIDERWQLEGDFTLRTMLDPVQTDSYLPLSFVAPVPVLFTDIWLEPEDQPAIRPAKGFYFPERDRDARLFRWMSPGAEAAAYLPASSARLRIRGEIPVEYYDLPVEISLTWNGTPLVSFPIATREFQVEHVLSRPPDEPWGTLRLESSQRFVPDEWQKSGDRRVLAARIYEMSLTALPDR